MVRVLLVGLGGFVGSVLRYLLSGLSQSIFTGEGLATLRKAHVHFYRSGGGHVELE